MAAQLSSVDETAEIHLQHCVFVRGCLQAAVLAHGPTSAAAAAAAASLGAAFEAAQRCAQGSQTGLCKIHRLWAASAALPLAAAGLGQPGKSRQLWDDMLQAAQPAQSKAAGSMHTVAMAWIECVELERRQYVAAAGGGSDAAARNRECVERVRGLYKGALDAPGLDNPVAVCESWLQWEREEGTPQSWFAAEKAVQTKYAALTAMYQPAAQTAGDASDNGSAAGGKKRKASGSGGEQQEKRARKEKNAANGSGDPLFALLERGAAEVLTLEPSATAGPTLDPHNLDRDEVARMRKQGSARAGHGENAGARKKSAAAKKGKIDHDMSVFVKNVPFDVSEETLRALFAEQIGAVAQAKLVMRPGTGKSRGFGYVEFVAQGAQLCRHLCHTPRGHACAGAEHVGAAIARQELAAGDGAGPLMLEGRKLSVSRSNLSAAIAEENKKKEEHAAKKRRKGARARGRLRRVAQCGTRGDPGPVCVQRRARAGPARRPSRGCSDCRCACLAALALFAARRSSRADPWACGAASPARQRGAGQRRGWAGQVERRVRGAVQEEGGVRQARPRKGPSVQVDWIC